MQRTRTFLSGLPVPQGLQRTSGTAPNVTGGFTLLEVVVALAILGIGLGVVFQGIGQGLRLRGKSADNVRLALVAESILGGLVERETAPEAPEEGEEGGCRWRLEPVEQSAVTGGGAAAAVTPDNRGAPLTGVRILITAPSGVRWEATTLLPRAKDTAP